MCTITYARIQGKNAMVAHFQNSSLLHEDKRCRPVLFHSEGPMAGATPNSGPPDVCSLLRCMLADSMNSKVVPLKCCA